MAISFVGAGSNAVESAGSPEVDLSGIGLQSGDLVIAVHAIGDDDNIDFDIQEPALTGVSFTQVADLVENGDGDDTNLGVFYGYYSGSDTTLTFSGQGGSDAANAAVVMVFRGVRAAADGGPFDVTSTTATGQSSGSPDPPSIDHSNTAGIWTVIVGAASHIAGPAVTFTFPTGYTTNATQVTGSDTNDVTVGVGYRSSGVSDPENPGAMTNADTASTNSWCAVTMALRAAAGVTDVSYDQAGFRGRNDDGSETTATWKAAENTDWSQVVDTNFRVRFVVDETASGTGSAQFDFKLQYNKNGAGWNDVNAASSVVRTVSSGNVSNGTATTQQLSSGSGTYVAGSIDSNNGALGLGNSGAPIDNGERSEGEWVVQVRSADVVGGDTIDLRVVETTGSVVLDAYSQVPTITVDLVSYTQAGFRGRNDDGSETTATWKAAENTNWTQAVDENVRVRFVLDETTGGTAGAEDIFQLQYRLNGGTWTNVDAASNVVRVSTSPNVANATATTRQLSSGTGTFEASEFDSNNGLASAAGALDSGNLTEPEYCVQIRSADVVADDTVELRVIRQDAATLDVYSNTPTITVGGASEISGSGDADLMPIQASGDGDVDTDGDGDADLMPISASGAGDVDVASTTGDADLMPVAASGAGDVVVASTAGDADLRPINASGAGDVDVASSAGDADLMPINASGAGSLGEPQVNGSGDADLMPISASGAGDVDVSGTGDADLMPIAASGTGDVDVSGTGDADLMPIAASGAGDVDVSGTGDSDLMPIAASGAGSLVTDTDASGAAALLPLAAEGDGAVIVEGTGELALVAITIDPRGVGHVFNTGGGVEGFEVARGPMGYGVNRRKKRFAQGEGRVQR